jgi:hypothetical protein
MRAIEVSGLYHFTNIAQAKQCYLAELGSAQSTAFEAGKPRKLAAHKTAAAMTVARHDGSVCPSMN